MVAPPFISLAVPGPTGERVSRFASFAILSIVAIISGIAIGFFSALNGLVIGVLFAIWGMPLVVLSVAVATVVKNRREAEFRLARRAADRLVEDGVAKGYCPNCEKLIALSSNGCAFCGADFGPNSAWKIQPTK